MENQVVPPLKIALIGYGKMGKAIEDLAASVSCQVVFVGDKDWFDQVEMLKQSGAQVAIEFSSPESAAENLLRLIELGIPSVCGSTGWMDREFEVKAACLKLNGSIMLGSNFSVGVHLFFALNKKLAHWMAGFPEYSVRLHEIHHTEKKDAPSGTAITTAKGIVDQHPAYTGWGLSKETEIKGHIPIQAERLNDVKGLHAVTWESDIDQIEFRHLAHSRAGFALGALRAAHWLHGKNGWFLVEEMYAFE
jgi:4-hydroxy-tetrahydrodipicolinate reductase